MLYVFGRTWSPSTRPHHHKAEDHNQHLYRHENVNFKIYLNLRQKMKQTKKNTTCLPHTYSSPHVGVIKSRQMRWVEYVAWMGKDECIYNFLL
jgi:hypothetical protein